MTKRISQGRCSLCNATFAKAAMTRHLASCKQRKGVSETSPEKRKARTTKLLHLVVEGRDLPAYWMHFEAKANATLEDVDDFLRRTWLECCGHLSAFKIQGRTYMSEPDEEDDEEGMDVVLSEVLSPGMRFYYEYDFGTTTELTLRVVSEREGEIRKPIRLLARNDSPLITCGSCEKIATQVCSECVHAGEGWLCDECAGEHECGEEMLLPVVNSPRVGMCAYTG